VLFLLLDVLSLASMLKTLTVCAFFGLFACASTRTNSVRPTATDDLAINSEDLRALRVIAREANLELSQVTVEDDPSRFPQYADGPTASVLIVNKRIIGFALQPLDLRPHVSIFETIGNIFSRRGDPCFPGFGSLSKLPRLESLVVDDAKVGPLRGAETLQALKRLRLNHAGVEDIQEICRLVQLRRLDLPYNQIKKGSCLSKLTRLEELVLSGNKLERLDGLDQLRALHKLSLDGNRLNTMPRLPAGSTMEYLDLSGNQLRRIEGVASLVGLRHLQLNSNKIERLEGLSSLASLETLNLEGNRIPQISNLEGLARLETLTLNRNPIQQIDGVEPLVRLKTLSLDFCPVRTLASVKLPPGLEVLSISQLANLDGLESILVRGKSLTLISIQDAHLAPEDRRRVKSLMKRFPRVYLRHCLKDADGNNSEC
jgi:Leucine-rich repeat (LRR) protein